MTQKPQPMIYSDPALCPPGREFWTTPQMVSGPRGRPTFGADEVAKVFFGTTGSWVRARLNEKHEFEVGVPFEPPRNPSGHRMFRLYDVEVWAHVLAQARVITGRQLELAVAAVRDVARIHDFIS